MHANTQAFPPHRRKNSWKIPAFLLVFALLPVSFGFLILVGILQGPDAVGFFRELTEDHHFDVPVPITIHITGGLLFGLLTPFQFAKGVRQRWPRFHRISGRFAMAGGLMFSITVFLLFNNLEHEVPTSLLVGQSLNAIGMIFALALALFTILRRDVAKHRKWMMHSYAMAFIGSSRSVMVMLFYPIFGEISIELEQLTLWIALIVNPAVVEFVLWREREKLATKRAVI